MSEATLRRLYEARRNIVLVQLAERIHGLLATYLEGAPRIDRISARAKGVDRFMAKAAKLSKGTPKYSDPINQIQDQVGARVVTFYLSDVDRVKQVIDAYFRPIEERRIVPDSVSEFGYEGHHYVLFVPNDVIDDDWERGDYPDFFELQIKTLFQHAWAEAGHDVGYKEFVPLIDDQKRKLAFTAAQSWGADMIFNDLFRDVNDQDQQGQD